MAKTPPKKTAKVPQIPNMPKKAFEKNALTDKEPKGVREGSPKDLMLDKKQMKPKGNPFAKKGKK